MTEAAPSLSPLHEVALNSPPPPMSSSPRTSTANSSASEGRDQWPSRLSFILAAMGGAVGVGNLLRYPSIAARHNGLQWFIPYFTALIIIGIPLLALEIALGQAMRGGAVVAFGAVNRRLRALGFTSCYMSITTATYYVVIMAWVMTFFRYSFVSPLPWLGVKGFFEDYVIRNVPAIVPTGAYFKAYPALGMVWETLAWVVLTWILVYFSIFKGVSVTGKVVYITMLLPMALCGALVIRAVTLEGASKGIMMYVGNFSSAKLMNGAIWKDAIIQIFFSIGIGFGTFIAYSSYSNIHANAVQDAMIVACSNSAFEVIVGFAAFAIIGNQGIDLTKAKLGSFDIGFTTYPQALGRLPGANIWSALFFFTIYLLAIDSAFALTESFAAVVTDTDWGKKVKKPVMMGIICFASFLCSTVYSTKFGSAFLDAVDWWLNGITLIFAAWAQVVAVTSIYRYKDVVSQTGFQAFVLAQVSYIVSMALGVLLAFTAGYAAAIPVFLLVLIGGTCTAAAIARPPEIRGGFGNKKFFNSLFWLTLYPGAMLTKDLNAVIAQGNNWNLPIFWAPTLRFITAPVLMYVLGIGYEEFAVDAKGSFKNDPLHLFGFILAHFGVAMIIVGYIWPKTFSVWVPRKELEADQRQYQAGPGLTLVHPGGNPESAKDIPFDASHESLPNTPKAAHMA